jgi:hypothetical protein
MHFTGYPQVISDVYFELRHIIYINIYISILNEMFIDVFSSIHSQQRSDPKIRQSLVEFLTSVTFVAIVQQMLQKPWLGFDRWGPSYMGAATDHHSSSLMVHQVQESWSSPGRYSVWHGTIEATPSESTGSMCIVRPTFREEQTKRGHFN